MTITKHIAVIPARAGSKGFPNKNRYFWDITQSFIEHFGIFSEVIVSTDDEVLQQRALEKGYTVRDRPEDLAGDTSSIKTVFDDVIATFPEKVEGAYLWLFYVPILTKYDHHFEQAKTILAEKQPDSLSTFVPAISHPYNTWKYTEDGMEKYIPNALYNRQDYPDAWENHHYVFAIKSDKVRESDNNLLSLGTYPIFLTKEEADSVVEVDIPEDLIKWKVADPQAFNDWVSKHEDIPLMGKIKELTNDR